MRFTIVLIISIFMNSCSSYQNHCGQRVCVHKDQAMSLDKKTTSMYRDNGLRVPIYIPDIQYPPSMVAQLKEAEVIVAIDIAPAGNVLKAVLVTEGVDDSFVQAAFDYVMKFKFEAQDRSTMGQKQMIVFALED